MKIILKIKEDIMKMMMDIKRKQNFKVVKENIINFIFKYSFHK